LKTPGFTTYENNEMELNNLQATNNFLKLIMKTDPHPEGNRLLEVTVEEFPLRNYLRLSLHYDELPCCAVQH
jgi:hypothetical protein